MPFAASVAVKAFVTVPTAWPALGVYVTAHLPPDRVQVEELKVPNALADLVKVTTPPGVVPPLMPVAVAVSVMPVVEPYTELTGPGVNASAGVAAVIV